MKNDRILCNSWIEMYVIFSERLWIFKPTSRMMYSNNSRFYRFFLNWNRLKTLFENAKNVRKSVFFSTYKCRENYTFPKLFLYFQREFSTDFKFEKTYRMYYYWRTSYSKLVWKFSAVQKIWHTFRLKNCTIFCHSSYTWYFCLRDIESAKIFGKIRFPTRCRNSNLSLYTWYNSVWYHILFYLQWIEFESKTYLLIFVPLIFFR